MRLFKIEFGINMRSLSVSVLVLSALGLSACASFHKKPPPPPPAESEEAAPPKTDAPNDGVERIENNQIAPPKKKGFFSRLSKAIGEDNQTPNAGPCPAVRILYDASRFVEVDGDNKFDNVGYTGEMQNVKSTCRYVGDDPIEISLAIDMALGKGPKASGDFKDVKYFISVTRKDIAPIETKTYTGRVYFAKGEDRTRFLTPISNITIPRKNKEVSGANFEILVGFDLTEKQLQFNRDGIRFKIDAGTKK